MIDLKKVFFGCADARPREKGDYTVFSYRNPRETFQDEDECILHRGLTRALTI